MDWVSTMDWKYLSNITVCSTEVLFWKLVCFTNSSVWIIQGEVAICIWVRCDHKGDIGCDVIFYKPLQRAQLWLEIFESAGLFAEACKKEKTTWLEERCGENLIFKLTLTSSSSGDLLVEKLFFNRDLLYFGTTKFNEKEKQNTVWGFGLSSSIVESATDLTEFDRVAL